MPSEPNPGRALRVLQELGLDRHQALKSVVRVLRMKAERFAAVGYAMRKTGETSVMNLLVGNNATAVDAAGVEAERLGYSHAMISATEPEGPAEEVALHYGAYGPIDARRFRDRERSPTV